MVSNFFFLEMWDSFFWNISNFQHQLTDIYIAIKGFSFINYKEKIFIFAFNAIFLLNSRKKSWLTIIFFP